MKTKVSFVRINTAGATESKDNGTIFGEASVCVC